MKDRKRTKISRKVLGALEILGDAALGTADFIQAFLNAGYGASSSRLEYELSKIEHRREKKLLEQNWKQGFYNLLSSLNKEGLIEKAENKKWRTTQKGFERLEMLKKRVLPGRAYESKPADDIKIVAFDIPEEFRFKRDWLRSKLENLGFKMLQRSLWFGKIGLPEEFIQDLYKFDLSRHVEIFAISKKGTLKSLIETNR